MEATTPIAIVGMGCRMPGDATSPEKLWKLISGGGTAWSEIPADRWTKSSFYHPHTERKGTMSLKGGHFLDEDVGRFDAPFFSITPSEAKVMDPQQRMLLEVAYEAVENAGIAIKDIAGSKTSCFVGDFSSRDYENNINSDIESSAMYQLSGNTMSIMSNRLSYFFDLRSPSMTVDTACSSSLVALHLACQSIRTKESDMPRGFDVDIYKAIVGGVNLMLSPDMTLSLDALHLLSPDSRSFAFDSRANGYARGEGIAVVLLKPLDTALRDNDMIRAVILGSGANHDGKTKGLHLPNTDTQELLIRDTYRNAGLDLADTAYCEAHGTGTAVGDPLEARALGATIGKARQSRSPLLLGSIKTNIGHLEGGAGLAGVIKAVLALEKGVIPPSVNFQEPTPRIPFKDWNLEIVTRPTPWPEGVRRVSVNSFGFGGTNAHVVIEDAVDHIKALGHTNGDVERYAHDPQSAEDASPHSHGINGLSNGDGAVRRENLATHNCVDVKVSGMAQRQILYPWSSNDEKGIARQWALYSQYLLAKSKEMTTANSNDSESQDALLQKLAYTMAERRNKFPWRAYTVASSIDSLREKLDRGSSRAVRTTGTPKLAFIFTGQGAQWQGMGRELRAYDIYNRRLLEADRFLKTLGCPWSVIDELERDKDTNINQASFSQPLCTAVQVALVDLLDSWRIQPTAVVGHSSGEIAAVYCAGSLSRESAWKLAYYRGQLRTHPGSMMAVALPESAIQLYLDRVSKGRVVVACVNSPGSLTVSGDTSGIDQLCEILNQEDVFARKLKVDTAYHSHHMKMVASEYRSAIEDVSPLPGNTSENAKMFSSVTSNLINSSAMGPDYWVENLISTVRFSDAVQTLCQYSTGKQRRRQKAADFVDTWLEIGPHSAMREPLKQILQRPNVSYESVLRRENNAAITALQAAGHLWVLGYPVKMSNVNTIGKPTGKAQPFLVDLPPYDWNHSARYWFEPQSSMAHRFRRHPRHDLFGAPLEASANPTWRHFLRMPENPWMEDHKVQSSIPYSSAGMLAMAVQGAYQLAQNTSKRVSAYELRNVYIERALMIPSSDHGIEVFLQFTPSATVRQHAAIHDFSIVSRGPAEHTWVENCSGQIVTQLEKDRPAWPGACEQDHEITLLKERLEDAKRTCTKAKKATDFYLDLLRSGMEYGATFQNLVDIRYGDQQAYCIAKVPDTAAVMPHQTESGHVIHPALLDSLTQMILPALSNPQEPLDQALVGSYIENIYIASTTCAQPGEYLEGCSTGRWLNSRTTEGSVFVADAGSKSVQVIVKNMRCVALPNESAKSDWQSFTETDPKLRKLTSQELWKVDVDMLADNAAIGLSEYIDNFAHKRPEAKILAVDGETCGLTHAVLHTLCGGKDRPPRCSSYTYTNGSVGVVDSAKSILAEWGQNVHFQPLNIERSLAEQGFENGSYDLVLVNMPSQASLDLERGLGYFKPLLASGGTMLTIEKPNGVLHKAEYAVNENKTPNNVIHDDWVNIPIHPSSTKVDRAAQNGKTEDDQQTRLLIVRPTEGNTTLEDLLDAMVEELIAVGATPLIKDVNNVVDQDSRGRLVIVLAEFLRPVLAKATSAGFEMMKRIVMNSRALLWVSNGDFMNGREPEMNLIVGFARTIRYETGAEKFATLDLAFDSNKNVNIEPHASKHSMASVITKIATLLLEEPNPSNTDREYACSNGRVYIPRIFPLQDLNDMFNKKTLTQGLKSLPLFQTGRVLKLMADERGALQDPQFADDTAASEPMHDSDVEIQVSASALNAVDLEARSGSLGVECAGIVTRVGRNVSVYRPGDHLMTWGRGCHSSHMRNPMDLFQPIPAHMSLEAAATIPWAYCTAFQALHEVARLQPGESILIHDTPGGIDQAAIILAQHFGAQVFATARNLEKRKLLTDTLHVEENHVFFSGNLDFAKGIMRLTRDRGVDVVLNGLSGEFLTQSWHCIAKAGCFVNLAAQYDAGRSLLDMHPFERNATFSSLNLLAIYDDDVIQAGKIFGKIGDLLRKGVVRPCQPILNYSYPNLGEAVKLLRKGDHLGKIVLQTGEHDRVLVLPSTSKRFHFDPQVSYVLVGGLGGLGRSVAKWMVDRGAKSIILLSRSGAQKPEAVQVVDELKAEGATVTVHVCDVADKSRLKSVIEECTKTLPPIRGVIQAAMNLRDSAFENMSAEDWSASLRPKVQGSRNLHECLPEDLDFFIMLSSSVGIAGNKGQANYAAGNTYQDALALHRRSKGLPATSLDLSWMIGAGVVAENLDLTWRVRYTGLEGMREDEFHILLEVAITGKVGTSDAADPSSSPLPPQIITGISTGGMIERSGATQISWMEDARFAHMRIIDLRRGGEARPKNTASQLKSQLRDAADFPAAALAVREALVGQLAQSTGLDAADVDVTKPIHAHGVDSIVAVDLRAWAKREVEAEVPALDILGSKPLEELAGKMAGLSALVKIQDEKEGS